MQYEHPVNTFDVTVKTEFVPDVRFRNVRQTKMRLSLQLTCRENSGYSLMCRTEKYNTIQLSTDASISRFKRQPHIVNSFDRVGVPFEVRFALDGVVAYAVPNNDAPSMKLINAYRMIANLMSIGTEIHNKNAFFMERSTVGYCPTDYRILRLPHRVDSKLLLSVYSDLKVHNDTVLITKRRYVDRCIRLSSYIFATKFWPELVPMSRFTEQIVRIVQIKQRASFSRVR